MSGPLAGLRVIDVANWLAAPAAAGLMSDLGADVIKVEPPSGDTYRGVLATMNPDAAVQAGWQNDNRGKRGVALDLERPEAQEVLLRLCDQADILITNFTPDRARRYGLTAEAVRARNPRIIFTSFSGYGNVGPDANRLGYDFLAFWARSGIMATIGDVSGPPVPPIAGQGDHTTTLNILAAVLVALRLRDQTGEGQLVEVTLQHTGVWTISNQVQGALLGDEPTPRNNRQAPTNPLSNTYPTADGRWMMFTIPQVDRDWPRFARALGHPEWAEEFPDYASVTTNAATLRERLEARFREQPLDYWRERLDAESLLWAPAAELAEVAADPQLRANGAFETVEHPVAGTIEMVAAPFRIAGADIRVRRSAPGIGEHTFEVLADYGFTPDEIAELAANRAFG